MAMPDSRSDGCTSRASEPSRTPRRSQCADGTRDTHSTMRSTACRCGVGPSRTTPLAALAGRTTARIRCPPAGTSVGHRRAGARWPSGGTASQPGASALPARTVRSSDETTTCTSGTAALDGSPRSRTAIAQATSIDCACRLRGPCRGSPIGLPFSGGRCGPGPSRWLRARTDAVRRTRSSKRTFPARVTVRLD